ncbi:MAG: ATP-binding protein [Pseudomonadota bacterium]
MKLTITKNRYLKDNIKENIKDKMIFIGGPRQVGKTTFALSYVGIEKGDLHPAYLNWDIKSHRDMIIKEEFPKFENLMIFDEIHKYSRWRRLMKGFYDEYYPKKNVIVTGSARLDYYKKGGDSLLGRYRYYRLHPYSLSEISKNPSNSDLEALLKFGGFPEPLSKSSENSWRLWQRERISRVIEDDLRDLERVNEISLLEVLMQALPDRVGSCLSLQSLREDLEVSHDSIGRWLCIFDNLYLTFRISPFGSPKIKAVKKEQKLYFWDWTQVPDEGIRFENMVAAQLLKYCHFIEDTSGYNMELRYIRDIEKREIDFVVLKEGKPLFAVECKLKFSNVSNVFKYFRLRAEIPKYFIVHLGEKDFGDEDINVRVIPFIKFVKLLDMP